ncbi:MAG: ABC transporter ATP-binding protein [Myxococcota bacterium]
MIEVERLTKHYGDRVAVQDVSFEVGEGDIVGFLGPNGAGKSTTLRMLTGYLAPTEGRIRIAGIDALADPIDARRRIGYMPEGVPLYPELRVHEYLRYRAELKGMRRRQIGDAVDRALDQAGVADARERIIGQLSKGYRQRVGLADALVADPPLLVLDEPTSGLDPNQIRQVRALVRSFAGKKTVLLSTHILPEVEATCGRVIIIHRGRVVGRGTPDTLRSSEGAVQTVTMLGRGEEAAFRRALEGVDAVRSVGEVVALDGGVLRLRVQTDAGAEATEAIFRAVTGAGLALRELKTEAASLEDVFTHLTTEEEAGASEPEADEDSDAGAPPEDDADAPADHDDESPAGATERPAREEADEP